MTTTAGIREFRADLASYIDAAEPVIVTRHGVTVGWFFPTPPTRDEKIASLRAAAARLDEQLAAHGIDPDELADEIERARKADHARATQ